MKKTIFFKMFLLAICISISAFVYGQNETELPEVSTMEEVIATLGDKDSVTGVQVLYKNLEPIFVAKSLYVDAFMPDNKTLINAQIVIPSNADVVGTYHYNTDYAGYRFRIDSLVTIHSFLSFHYIKNYYEQTNDARALEPIATTQPMTVTAVDGNNVFVQYQNLEKNTLSDMMVIEGTNTLAVGDMLVGTKVKYSPALIDTTSEEDNNTVITRNPYFIANADELGNKTVNNKFRYTPLSSINENTLRNNAAKAVQLPTGGFIKKDGDKYFYNIDTITVGIKSSIVNLNDYLNRTIEEVIFGVVDYNNTASNVVTIIINEIKILDTNYATIAEWIEAAQLGISHGSLKNPVAVTLNAYKSSKTFIFIEDETGALCLNFGRNEVTAVDAGDLITGVKGSIIYASATNSMIAPQIELTPTDADNFKIVGKKVIEPMDVTVAQLLEEEKAAKNGEIASKYANRLVRLHGVKKTARQIGKDPKIYGLSQGGINVLPYSTTTLADFANSLEDYQMTIIGVADFQTINSSQLYSIYPRSTDDVHLVAPEFVQGAGEYEKEVAVELTILGTKGKDYVDVYYTLDGSNPYVNGEPYTQPIKITATTTIKAVATYKEDETKQSPIVSKTYTIVDEIKIATPQFTPEEGEYKESVDVTITCETPNTAIFYDVTGTEATIKSVRYNGTITLKSSTTINAIAALVDADGNVRFDTNGKPYISQNISAKYMINNTKYTPMVIEGYAWNVVNLSAPVDGSMTTHYTTYTETIAGDTLVNGITYKKLMRGEANAPETNKLFALIREDIDAQCVYVLEGETESLVYNFGAQVGETISVCGIIGSTDKFKMMMSIVVDKIDTIEHETYGQLRVFTYHTNSNKNETFEVYERYGTLTGWSKYPYTTTGGGVDFMICAFGANGELEFKPQHNVEKIDNIENCYLKETISDVENTPFNNTIYFDTKTETLHFIDEIPSEITIYDIMGKVVFATTNNQASQLHINLSQGIYVVKGNNIYTKIIIK